MPDQLGTARKRAKREPVPAIPVGRTRTGGAPAERRDLRRVAAFALLAITCVVGALGYVVWTAANKGVSVGAAPPPSLSAAPLASLQPSTPASTPGPVTPPSPVPATPSKLLFQSVIRDDTYAHVAELPLGAPDLGRSVTSLVCERVHYAAGHGLCLVPENGLVSTYYAVTFGPDFVPRSRLALAGAASRARVSPDGRYGAATVFVFGHSYADVYFSTQTIIIDMANGANIGHLEQFTVLRDGTPISAPDFNFWGVTFAAQSDRFFATLRTGGRNYLVEGSVASREMRVIHEGVECPSLSPDGTHIGFKKRVENGIGTSWRLYVLDLATMAETPLADRRDIDDQVEWLDDQNLVYGAEGSLWSLPIDGGGSARLIVKDALSPAVVH